MAESIPEVINNAPVGYPAVGGRIAGFAHTPPLAGIELNYEYEHFRDISKGVSVVLSRIIL